MTDQNITTPAATTTDYLILETNNMMLPGEEGNATFEVDVRFIEALEKGKNKVFMPSPEQDGDVGTIATVELVNFHENSVDIKITAEGRGRLHSIKPDTVKGGDVDYAVVEAVDAKQADINLVIAALDRFKDLFQDIVLKDGVEFLKDIAKTKPEAIADKLLHILEANGVIGDTTAKQELLQETDPDERLKFMLRFFAKIEVEAAAQMELMEEQRKYGLKQLRDFINNELGEGAEAEFDALAGQILAAGMTQQAQDKSLRKLNELRQLHAQDPQAGKLREYLAVMLSYPWNKTTPPQDSMEFAEEVLDADHYGLDDVKEEIIEHLSVQARGKKMTGETGEAKKGTIILLDGPPGVGKTSISKSIARALGRKFGRLSLSNVNDKGAISGHAITYIGAEPGGIAKAIIEAGTNNPVILLDEIEKMGHSRENGDPESALLQVTDPNQNTAFRDQYMDVDIDLSDVVFIATANDISQMSEALLNRFNVISLNGYNHDEKIEIAQQHLIKGQLKEKNLRTDQFSLTKDGLTALVEGYTLEPGVRNLERLIGKLMKKAGREIDKEPSLSVKVEAKDLEKYLGPVVFERKPVDATPRIGHVNGLAVVGGITGDVLPIDAISFEVVDGAGRVEATGNLQQTISESVEYADAYVKSHAKELGFEKEEYLNNTVHIRVGAGGTPTDGPSAGLAFATALTSVRANIPVRGDVAMTGEIGVFGESRPIGGVDHKIDGALKGGVPTVLIPTDNLKDLDDPQFPKKLKEKLEIVRDANSIDPHKPVPEGKVRVIAVNNISEVFNHALEPLTQIQIGADFSQQATRKPANDIAVPLPAIAKTKKESKKAAKKEAKKAKVAHLS